MIAVWSRRAGHARLLAARKLVSRVNVMVAGPTVCPISAAYSKEPVSFHSYPPPSGREVTVTTRLILLSPCQRRPWRCNDCGGERYLRKLRKIAEMMAGRSTARCPSRGSLATPTYAITPPPRPCALPRSAGVS